MSSTAAPISPAAFAAAIQDLPLENLHFKAAELQNSKAHLRHSNDQLKPFAEEGDEDCAEAIRENEEVIGRMEERIAALRQEVERRGFLWSEVEMEEREIQGLQTADAAGVDGMSEDGPDRLASVHPTSRPNPEQSIGGRLSDAELQRRLRERMEVDEGSEGGIHL